MRRSICGFLALMLLACGSLARADQAALLERGTTIDEPAVLRELDHGVFGLNRMLAPSRASDAPLSDAELFTLPALVRIREAIDAEVTGYVRRHKATLPGESIGVGSSFAFQLFDQSVLDAPDARFVLAGIVNRMDRAYADPGHCGEIRLIYRLTRTGTLGADALRLPMTLNLVLRARGDDAVASGAPSCAEIARRWFATADTKETGAELVTELAGANGPLALIKANQVVRIETNLQIAHAPKSAVRDFRTDYLMKVFDYHAATGSFEEAVMEDQIDRDRLLADADLARAFKDWLLQPAHLGELDRGTVLIPDKFLAKAAIAPTPAGLTDSELLPAFGLVQGDGRTTAPVFSSDEVVGALAKAAASGIAMQNIRSVAGFARRLNDIGCAGCHQTRGIGGFHFPGVDWMVAKPSNTIVVPASPHFFGDQVRRRDILEAFRDGRPPDFSRGFASRPQLRGSTELAGTEYSDGWGGHCYVRHAKAGENDASFIGWSCAKGLACQTGPATRMGMCFISTR